MNLLQVSNMTFDPCFKVDLQHNTKKVYISLKRSNLRYFFILGLSCTQNFKKTILCGHVKSGNVGMYG